MVKSSVDRIESDVVITRELVDINRVRSESDHDPGKRTRVMCLEHDLRTKDIAVERGAPCEVGYRETEVGHADLLRPLNTQRWHARIMPDRERYYERADRQFCRERRQSSASATGVKCHVPSTTRTDSRVE